MPLVKLLNPKIRNMCDNRRLLALDALREIWALAMHNNNLSREREENQFLIYPVPDFLTEAKS